MWWHATRSASRCLPSALRRKWICCCNNARSFAPDDGWVRIGLYACDDGAQISVVNNGPLLPPAMQDRLFDSLVSVRAASALKPADSVRGRSDAPHLGLGLYVVRLIAEAHRGEASARDSPPVRPVLSASCRSSASPPCDTTP